MPDLRSLETFFWVAQLGSFRGASERLHMTQPAVSLRIAQLEEELGVRLFDRGPRVATLTAKGRLLLGYADRLLRLRAEMMTAIADPEALTGVVRLGVAETIVHTWLSRYIERVHAAFPRSRWRSRSTSRRTSATPSWRTGSSWPFCSAR